jgi:DDE superfamily endonuclease
VLNGNQPQDNDQNLPMWLLSVDGTHCRIQEPRKDPNKNLYSHKHKKACYSYEIGLDLFESRIVWVSGPHDGGEPDIVIFRKANGLRANIPHNKKAIGDLGYRGDLKVSVPNEHDSRSVNKFKRRARARHEDLNQILKSFYVLSGKFRHGCREKHQIVFEAVTVLVQYSLEDDRKLLEI